MKPLMLAATLFLFLLGCRENGNPISKSNQQSPGGNVAFTFDKVNAPAAVQTITTTLSRAGFDSITKTIDIDSDTFAVILFKEVPVGTWHIRVDAKDDEGKVLYTGQADVTVLEGMLSQVNLVLSPAATGVGNVLINVTWGVTQTSVQDYGSNPIFSKKGTTLDWNGVGQPEIFFDGELYYMYYQNYGTPGSIGYAVSTDAIYWERPESSVVLVAQAIGKWNITGISSGPVFEVGDKYFMLFQGYANGIIEIGLAFSDNKQHWIPHNTPVLTALTGEQYLVARSVLMIDSLYYMYFSVRQFSGDGFCGVATSTDGIHWSRRNTPFLTASQAWESGGVRYPAVYRDGAVFKMIYHNGSDFPGIAFGYATSSDGINWVKDAGNPIFTNAQTVNNWAPGGIAYPTLAKVGKELRIYYTGVMSNGEWKIGLAHLK